METASLLLSIKVEAIHHRGEARMRLHPSYDKNVVTNGSAIWYIQKAMGHESICTKKVYTHVAKDRKPASPLDTLKNE